jgi:hypothetical protein
VGLEARHLIPALPAALLFAAAGFKYIAPRRSDWRLAALALVIIAAMVPALLPLTTKGYSGFAPVALSMLSDAGPHDATLVSSDAVGEGIFISEVALHESRPGHVIQRASKSLAISTWSGSGYTPAFTKDEDVYAFLTSGQIRYLVLDDSIPQDHRREHHDQLLRVVTAHPSRFQLLSASDVWRAGIQQPELLKLYKIATKN